MREKLFAGSVAVLIDNSYGTVQNGLRGAIVLFQQDDFRVLKIFLKALNVAVIRSPPAIDGLVFIPHNVQVFMYPGEVTQDGILGIIGILEFIHQDMLEFVPIGVPHNRIALKKLVGIDQHIVKVHGVILHQALLIKGIKPFGLFIPEILDRESFWQNQIVLGVGYGG